MDQERRVIEFTGHDQLLIVLGTGDENLKLIKKGFPQVSFLPRGNRLIITGPQNPVEEAQSIFDILIERVSRGNRVTRDDVLNLIEDFGNGNGRLNGQNSASSLVVSRQGKVVRPRTSAQRGYIEAMRKNDVVFCIGPAGTGKTYLAVAFALSLIYRGEIRRIVLTRPAVEAGEKLGFLPGDLAEKVNPYLRPLYDALYDMLDVGDFEKMMNHNVIEIAPLAFMRGRTLNDALVILDEAQNTTRMQMKMFLTRIGRKSRAVITGDITQTDIPRGEESGLKSAPSILKDVAGIGFVYLSQKDVVRHHLIEKIVEAYESSDSQGVERR